MVCRGGTKSVLICNAFKEFLPNFRIAILNYNPNLTETQIKKLAKYYFSEDLDLNLDICPKVLRKRCSFNEPEKDNKIIQAKYNNYVAHLPTFKFKFLDGRSNKLINERNALLEKLGPNIEIPMRTVTNYYKTLQEDIQNNAINDLLNRPTNKIKIPKNKKRVASNILLSDLNNLPKRKNPSKSSSFLTTPKKSKSSSKNRSLQSLSNYKSRKFPSLKKPYRKSSTSKKSKSRRMNISPKNMQSMDDINEVIFSVPANPPHNRSKKKKIPALLKMSDDDYADMARIRNPNRRTTVRWDQIAVNDRKRSQSGAYGSNDVSMIGNQ